MPSPPSVGEAFFNLMAKYFFFFLSCVFFVACQSDEPTPVPAEKPFTERCLLVWLAGDNDLSSEVSAKIAGLAAGYYGAEQEDARILVYSDKRGAYPQITEINSRGELITIETYPPLNSASGETVERILSRMIELCPANSYGLIVFSHATGWLPQGAFSDPYNFASDTLSRSILDDNGEQLNTDVFANSIPLPPTGKYEYIVFENCLTAGIEIVYPLKEKAKHLLVSSAEVLAPGFKDIYPDALKYLLQQNADVVAFAKAFFNHCNSLQDPYRSATVSVINTAALDELASTLQGFYSIAPLEQYYIKDFQRFNRHEYTLFFDLEEAVETIAPDKLSAFRTALGNAIEYSAATPYFTKGQNYFLTINRHCGLTTYLPQKSFPDLNEEYRRTTWHKATH